ncbi:MAG: hypothetical protein C0596_06340 [Marinilabiliales bacterium]|nr:MAG: hypothetical protein C0596_06340 [Marinilabiliales bacterium]
MKNKITYILLIILIVLLVVPHLTKAQNNILVLNGAKIVLNGGRKDTCINLVINQAHTSGIQRNSGYIISEKQYNYIKWITCTASGTYVMPFGLEDDYIPFSFTKKNGNVDLSFSTWGTNQQNIPHPDQSSVAGVNNMAEETDSIVYAIDRFWDIVSTGAVSAYITFSYRGVENTKETPQSIVKAQHWNGNFWDDPVGLGNVGVISGVGTVGPIADICTFSPWVLVINSPCIPAYNYVSEEICEGESIYLAGEYQTEPGVYYDIIYEGSVSGCDSIIETTLIVYDNPYFNSILVTDVTTCTEPHDGEIVVEAVGGNAPYEFSFQGGNYSSNNTYGGLSVGAYLLDVIDANGCGSDTIVLVENNTGFYIDSVEVSELTCYGDTDGQLIIYSENAVSYSIDNGDNFSANNTFIGLMSGVYYVIARDGGGCEDIIVAYVSEPDEIEITHIHFDATCGESDGSASVIVTGGTPPYLYLWSNGSTTQGVNNIEAGEYGISVTDANGCTMSETVVVGNTGNNIELGSPSFSNINCYGNENAWIKINITEGTGPFTISWSNSMSTDSIFNLSSGTY